MHFTTCYKLSNTYIHGKEKKEYINKEEEKIDKLLHLTPAGNTIFVGVIFVVNRVVVWVGWWISHGVGDEVVWIGVEQAGGIGGVGEVRVRVGVGGVDLRGLDGVVGGGGVKGRSGEVVVRTGNSCVQIKGSIVFNGNCLKIIGIVSVNLRRRRRRTCNWIVRDGEEDLLRRREARHRSRHFRSEIVCIGVVGVNIGIVMVD